VIGSVPGLVPPVFVGWPGVSSRGDGSNAPRRRIADSRLRNPSLEPRSSRREEAHSLSGSKTVAALYERRRRTKFLEVSRRSQTAATEQPKKNQGARKTGRP